jgi:1-acyl-sn-glycerol-3-phosphate acyltransferase
MNGLFMNGLFKHPMRVGSRLIWLAFELFWAALNYVFYVPFSPESRLKARAQWLQRGSRRVLKIFDAEIGVAGPIPKNGLLVSNHLSYLDIFALSALTPCIFVAKCEVRRWPIFGWFARLSGTLFADRSRRTQVGPLTAQIQGALERGALVVIFPEGTSSDGQDVLPFKSSLLEPGAKAAHPLAASHVRYELDDGNVAEEVCYWKDMTFAPHLLNLLGKSRIRVFLRFCALSRHSENRKKLAQQLRGAVLSLKAASDQFSRAQIAVQNREHHALERIQSDTPSQSAERFFLVKCSK